MSKAPIRSHKWINKQHQGKDNVIWANVSTSTTSPIESQSFFSLIANLAPQMRSSNTRVWGLLDKSKPNPLPPAPSTPPLQKKLHGLVQPCHLSVNCQCLSFRVFSRTRTPCSSSSVGTTRTQRGTKTNQT